MNTQFIKTNFKNDDTQHNKTKKNYIYFTRSQIIKINK